MLVARLDLKALAKVMASIQGTHLPGHSGGPLYGLFTYYTTDFLKRKASFHGITHESGKWQRLTITAMLAILHESGFHGYLV